MIRKFLFHKFVINAIYTATFYFINRVPLKVADFCRMSSRDRDAIFQRGNSFGRAVFFTAGIPCELVVQSPRLVTRREVHGLKSSHRSGPREVFI